jgi:hypothetical protein
MTGREVKEVNMTGREVNGVNMTGKLIKVKISCEHKAENGEEVSKEEVFGSRYQSLFYTRYHIYIYYLWSRSKLVCK